MNQQLDLCFDYLEQAEQDLDKLKDLFIEIALNEQKDLSKERETFKDPHFHPYKR